MFKRHIRHLPLGVFLSLTACSIGFEDPKPEATSRGASIEVQGPLPCSLDAYRWRFIGTSCNSSYWLVTPNPDGTVSLQEHGCAGLRGSVDLLPGGDVFMEASGSGYEMEFTVHTSTGACDDIPVTWVALSGGMRGTANELLLRRVGPR
jgi:hypothetical protein